MNPSRRWFITAAQLGVVLLIGAVAMGLLTGGVEFAAALAVVIGGGYLSCVAIIFVGSNLSSLFGMRNASH